MNSGSLSLATALQFLTTQYLHLLRLFQFTRPFCNGQDEAYAYTTCVRALCPGRSYGKGQQSLMAYDNIGQANLTSPMASRTMPLVSTSETPLKTMPLVSTNVSQLRITLPSVTPLRTMPLVSTSVTLLKTMPSASTSAMQTIDIAQSVGQFTHEVQGKLLYVVHVSSSLVLQ